jgi:hypothetical protein
MVQNMLDSVPQIQFTTLMVEICTTCSRIRARRSTVRSHYIIQTTQLNVTEKSTMSVAMSQHFWPPSTSDQGRCPGLGCTGTTKNARAVTDRLPPRLFVAVEGGIYGAQNLCLWEGLNFKVLHWPNGLKKSHSKDAFQYRVVGLLLYRETQKHFFALWHSQVRRGSQFFYKLDGLAQIEEVCITDVQSQDYKINYIVYEQDTPELSSR